MTQVSHFDPEFAITGICGLINFVSSRVFQVRTNVDQCVHKLMEVLGINRSRYQHLPFEIQMVLTPLFWTEMVLRISKEKDKGCGLVARDQHPGFDINERGLPIVERRD